MIAIRSRIRPASTVATLAALATSALAACSGAVAPATAGSGADTAVSGGDTVEVDTVEIVSGVPDKGRDPAVVAIDVAGVGLCTGTLIATNVVLTARHCVSETVESVSCPSSGAQITRDRAPSSLALFAGDDIRTARHIAQGHALVLPRSEQLCEADIAAIILDRDVEGIDPLAVGKIAPKVGDRIRAVGFGKSRDYGPAGTKLLRDFVRIQSVSPSEFLVGEATCQGDSGGPAIDARGALIGVVSRGGPACEGGDVHNVYTRAGVFDNLIADALARAAASAESDAGVIDVSKGNASDAGTKKGGKPPTDMGESCRSGSDCSTGMCVKNGSETYCSRTCGASEHCPTNYKCTHTKSGKAVCVAK